MTGTLPSASSPWRLRDFRVLFAAASLSHLGVNVGYVALPLLAVTVLDAGPGQVGALGALSTVAFLVLGLPAGAWVDRLPARRVLVAADALRAALFASVPVAWWLGVLSLPQLYAVAVLNGCATVFFDVGSQSVLPQLVGRERLVRANSAMVGLMAGAQIAGRGAGGLLVQLLAAPLAILAAAVAYLAAAFGLTGIGRGQRGDGRPTAQAGRHPGAPTRNRSPRLRTEIGVGLRHVLGDRVLRALVLTAALANVGSQTVNVMLPVLFSRELGLPAGALGTYWAAGGVGLLLGAVLARPLAARLGHGRALAWCGCCVAPVALVIGLVGEGPRLWAAGAAWTVVMAKIGVDNVLGVSLRQQVTPDALLGRMNATFRFALTGSMAVAAVLAGLLGQLAGVRAAVWAGAVCMAGAFLPVFLSPLRTLRKLPAAPTSGCGSASGAQGTTTEA
ncbi:MFS transporter [Streptomyces sp. NPDC056600]|uniref:MFS transporter n=1 Tax=Streptomyces sp. NPDC056600 TaxID=3345874 RepID=UPI0036835F6F